MAIATHHGSLSEMKKVVWLLCLLLIPAAVRAKVELGVDNFLHNYTSLVRDKRIGIITNQTGRTGDGRSTLDAVRTVPGVTLAAIFTPEHGLQGTVNAGEKVLSYFDSAFNAPVYSLYGSRRKPSPAMLKGLDALIFDIQDIGVRSYTFISTLGLAMQSAGENGVPFIVFDRPSPLGNRIDGNVLDTLYRSFVGRYPLPYVYGLTIGELARMINEEGMNGAPCNLTIVPMRGWRRSMTWDQTGLSWTPPSPNIPFPSTAVYYAAFGALGELGIGGYQGIGTRDAFRVFALPNPEGKNFAHLILSREIKGLRCIPFDTVVSRQSGSKAFTGVRFILDEQSSGDLAIDGLEVLSMLTKIHAVSPPDSAHCAMFAKIAGAGYLMRILNGENVLDIEREWTPALIKYSALRKRYLLYEGDHSDDGAAR